MQVLDALLIISQPPRFMRAPRMNLVQHPGGGSDRSTCVPAGESAGSEKIVSYFEPHTDIIRRNQAHKPTEYGHKVWLDEVDGGIVTRREVLDGNLSDDLQWVASLEHHQKLFGRPPGQASRDRGVHFPNNERMAQEKGVKRVILPQPGKKSAIRKRYERQPWFVRGRKWHVGIEGRISVLKRRFNLDRCLNRSETGFEKWVG